MRYAKTLTRTLVCLLAVAAAAPAVEYRLRIRMTWDDTHPGGWDPAAHLSHLGVITHDASTSFWELGELATPGIANMAVTGCVDSLAFPCLPNAQFPTTLKQEADLEIASNHAQFLYVFKQGFSSPGVFDVFFDVEELFPYLTFVSMIGPSPDWFVGVSGLNLRPGDDWLHSTASNMTIYDAGIKSANELVFNPNGPDENPQKPIQVLTAHPLGSSPIGSYELTKTPEPGTLVLLSCGLAALWYRRRG